MERKQENPLPAKQQEWARLEFCGTDWIEIQKSHLYSISYTRHSVSAQIKRFLFCINYLTVQANSQKHEKEKNGPQGADRHLSNGFWVTHKGKSGTYEQTNKQTKTWFSNCQFPFRSTIS